jgi:hypothetical protein
MNNSLPRLIGGVVATLREAILPHVHDDFARGQVFGIIYMLKSIERRVAWSNEFLCEQLQALADFDSELAAIAPDLPRPLNTAAANLPRAADLETHRDEGDARVCELIDWLAAHRPALEGATLARIEEALDRYMTRQIKWDISTSAKPMFEEISRGAEK